MFINLNFSKRNSCFGCTIGGLINACTLHKTSFFPKKPSIEYSYQTPSSSIFSLETLITGRSDNNPIKLPVPHLFFKSVLAERRSGALHMWSFVIPHESSRKSLDKFQVPTTHVEVMVGVNLWSQLTGTKIKQEKNKTRSIWQH